MYRICNRSQENTVVRSIRTPATLFSATSSPLLEIRFCLCGLERNPESGFDRDGGAVFRGGLKLPLGDGVAGESVQTIIHAAQHAYRAYRAVGEDDGVKDDSASYILLHQLQWIRRVHFARGHRRRKISRSDLAGGIGWS